MREEKIFFKNSKGQKLCGILYTPDGKGPFPIAVICHGSHSSKESDNTIGSVLKFIGNGVASFAFDFHGHGESDGNIEDFLAIPSIDDLRCALAFITKKDFIDSNKIGLYGSSFAGISTIIVTSEDSRIKCLALRAPVSNPNKTSSRHGLADWKKKGYRIKATSRYGDIHIPFSFYENLKDINLFNYAKKIDIPVYIVCGDADTTVFPEEVKKLYDQFSGKKKIKWLKGVSHGSGAMTKEDKCEIIGEMAEWMAKQLK